MKRFSPGFTLIELMIAIVVLGILAAIAYPSYSRYVEQARRADGKSALLAAAQRLERCYPQNNNSYVGCPVQIGATTEGYYSITVPIHEANRFELRAAPRGPQLKSPCGTYILDSEGNRNVTPDATLGRDRCW